MPQPNIIVILIDDMGVRDLGCTGSSFYETPHLDRLAAGGVNLTQGYAASALCSPARAAIMTGRCPARVGITNYIPGNGIGRLRGPEYHHALPRGERTIATALREGGYHTWHIGKWHLGGAGSLPTDHGFEVNIGGDQRGSAAGFPGVYFGPWASRDGTTPPGLEHSAPGEYLTDRLTDEAIGLIRANRDGRPFFMHLSHYAVHTPIVSPPDLVQRYEAKARRLGLDRVQALVEGELHPALHLMGQRIQRRVLQSHAGYAAMVHNLDWNAGRLLAALDECGQAGNTLVVFLSDNGGLSVGVEGSPTCTLPYAEGKGWSEEGGLRIPFLVRWPDRIPGGRTLPTPMWQCDLYPTFLDAAGLPAEPDRHRDGVSTLQALAGGPAPARSPFCWHYPHYSNQGGGPTGAIRCGDGKLIEHYETGRCQLFDLANDVAEAFDLAARYPERVADLARRLADWRREVGAAMPEPNPLYDDIVAGRLPRPDGNGRLPAPAGQ